jgi:hypothetical protein
MPNYCDNTLYVSGPADDVRAFAVDAAGDENILSFQQLCPEPDFGTLGGRDSWYDWRILHWGTKWDADDVEGGVGSDSEIEYTFQTAWSPPIGAIQSATLRWPTLTFTLSYAESGADVAGQTVWRAGACLDERSGSYNEIATEGRSAGPLHRLCATLPHSPEQHARQELRGQLDTNAMRAISSNDSATALFLRLNDLELCRDYVEDLSTTLDDLWRLGALALTRGHGSAPLKVLVASTDSSKAAIGRLLSTLGTVLQPPELDDLGDDSSVVTGGGVDDDATAGVPLDTLRAWFDRSVHVQLDGEWVEAVMSLFPGWTSSDAADLYHAAWLLVAE